MKKLSQLLTSIKPLQVVGDANVDITDVINDSRLASEGALFVAVKGVAVDSHRFIADVVNAGARAVVCEEMPAELNPAATYIQVDNSIVALAHIADEWFDHPSKALRLVGVTGTNGKTTTATLLYEMARLMGHKAGLLSTVKNIIDTREQEAKQTTPDHLTLNRLLHEMVQAGCEYAFMEVSSHACVQRRIEGITFAGGIFTNLTRDHLDFHKTVDNYIAAKKMFFDALPADAFALVNADDKVGEVMLQNTRAGKYRYSLRSIADYKGRIVESRLDGTTLELNGNLVEVLFTGRFNAYNLLSVYGASLLLGFDPQQVLVKMSLLEPVAGRFQTLRSARGYTAIVDYAHTPDALVNVLDTIREVVGTTGHIITVCGCGGNRDAGKRPIMAREAAVRSDKVILTSDNPRNEDPDAILRDMEVGLPEESRPTTLTITDRRQAIRTACQLAQAGDVVLIAGKGHEDYQEIMGVKHHFDDREQVLEVFAAEQPSK
ncbi:MAG: UDP-N-acetylmuramoyl-L-alanyl-D-glutamate--2,6-diaminopimelate ligase [Muribaculaceae bacterium]|nr:UDP-N-acetylmuramoyl-L-alanyl-D-glutamate--2,6-diaminopimelate ligase [Muribaculaceae bacterium]